MTQAAKKLLVEFEALQDADRTEALAELSRRVASRCLGATFPAR